MSMKQLDDIIKEIDKNNDGKLTLEEVRAVQKRINKKKQEK